MKIFVLIGIAFFSMSCATAGPSKFSRPDTSEDVSYKDLVQCRDTVRNAGELFVGAGIIGLANKEEIQAGDIEKCMVAKGYKCIERCNRGLGYAYTGTK